MSKMHMVHMPFKSTLAMLKVEITFLKKMYIPIKWVETHDLILKFDIFPFQTGNLSDCVEVLY